MTIALVSCALVSGRGQAQAPLDGNEEEARKKGFEFIKQTRPDFELFREGQPDRPLDAVDEPIFRLSNPIRNASYGNLYLWVDGKRPVAIATIAIRGNGSVWLETASLSPGALRCARKGREFWMPQAASLVEQRLSDAPVPATSAPSRLTQMRRLCEQFAFHTEPVDVKEIPLQLKPQPVYRFESSAEAILDGALFFFTESTDPEAALLLEAVRAEGSEPAFWRFTLARMSSRPVVAKRNEAVVWSVPGYWSNPRSASDAYQERQLSLYPPPIK